MDVTQAARRAAAYLPGGLHLRARGRDALVRLICDPRTLLATYNDAASAHPRNDGQALALWSPELLKALSDGGSKCPLVKSVREPDAGNLHVRFDERRRETEPRPRLRHRRLAKAAGNSNSLGLKPPRPPPTLP